MHGNIFDTQPTIEGTTNDNTSLAFPFSLGFMFGPLCHNFINNHLLFFI
jgi:hypothetical protein